MDRCIEREIGSPVEGGDARPLPIHVFWPGHLPVVDCWCFPMMGWRDAVEDGKKIRQAVYIHRDGKVGKA